MREPEDHRSSADEARRIADPPDGAPAHCLRVMLFDAHGIDRELQLAQVDPGRLSCEQLLWVDLQCGDPAAVREVAAKLGLPPRLCHALVDTDSNPRLDTGGGWYHARVVAADHVGGLKFEGRVLSLVAGSNCVFSVHGRPVSFIDTLRERERGDSELGVLSAASFTASLLDWQLSSYFDAVSDLEASVDRLEVAVLASRSGRDCMDELVQLRRAASRLRRMLAPHRVVFAAMARPDFHPRDDGDGANVHFLALDAHFERAMDMVENARELVIGSFELFTSRIAQRTNETMRVLTFVTVLLGTLAVVAGVLGMNFQAPLFRSAGTGFWITVASMAALALGAFLVGRWRRWL